MAALTALFGILMFFTALFLILLVLVQRGRGGGLSGALGGMGGQSAFGTKAGDLFTRITIVVAAFWILLCIAAILVSESPVVQYRAVTAKGWNTRCRVWSSVAARPKRKRRRVVRRPHPVALRRQVARRRPRKLALPRPRPAVHPRPVRLSLVPVRPEVISHRAELPRRNQPRRRSDADGAEPAAALVPRPVNR